MALLQTYYDILGIHESATEAQIKAAFRKLAKQFHPDKNPKGKEEFEKIVAAYEVLGDSAKKHRYDLKLKGYSSSNGGIKSTTTKQWGFSEEELRRRQYFQEHYKAEYQKYSKYQEQVKAKGGYNEYKYILFATPIAVALFMLVIKGFNSEKSEITTIENSYNEIQDLRMGTNPFGSYFEEAVYDTIANRKLILKNLSGSDLFVKLTSRDGKYIRSCLIKDSYYVELEQLPNQIENISILYGKNWSNAKTYKGLEVKGGFVKDEKFVSCPVARTNGLNILIDQHFLTECNETNEKDFFKNH